MDIEVEIDDCDSLPEEMIRNRHEHDATSAYIDDYRCFNLIETDENELFLLVISYVLDFSPIYIDEKEIEKKKVHTRLEVDFRWADVTKIENKDEEKAKFEIWDRICYGDLYSPYQ